MACKEVKRGEGPRGTRPEPKNKPQQGSGDTEAVKEKPVGGMVVEVQFYCSY